MKTQEIRRYLAGLYQSNCYRGYKLALHLLLMVEMLRERQRLGGNSPWVLPMPTNPDRPMNGNNLDGAHHAAITAAKIEDYVIHDHRHTASTHLREMGHLPEVVETALSHAIH